MNSKLQDVMKFLEEDNISGALNLLSRLENVDQEFIVILKRRNNKLIKDKLILSFEEQRILENLLVKDILDFVSRYKPEIPYSVSQDLYPYVVGRLSAHHHHIYGGRFYEQETILEYIEDGEKFIIIHGDSGVGKSSFLDAGIIGKLVISTIKSYEYVFLRPKGSLFDNLAENLWLNYKKFYNEDEKTISKELSTNGVIALEKYLKPVMNSMNGVFIIAIDQMEELFTLGERQEADGFINMIVEYASSNDRILVLSTIRSDYVEALSSIMNPLVSFKLYSLNPLDEKSLRAAIKKPIKSKQLSKWVIEEDLVDRLIKDTGIRLGKELNLISRCLNKLQRISVKSKVLALNKYLEFGGLYGLLNEESNQLFKSDSFEKDDLDLLFYYLTKFDSNTGEFVKRPMQLTAIEHNARLVTIVNSLIDNNILSKSQDDSIELSHEMLFENWSVLNDWLRKEKEFGKKKEKYRSLNQKITYLTNQSKEFQKNIKTDEGDDKHKVALNKESLLISDKKDLIKHQTTLKTYKEEWKKMNEGNVDVEFFHEDRFLLKSENLIRRIEFCEVLENGKISEISNFINTGVELQVADVWSKRLPIVVYAAITGDDKIDILTEEEKNLWKNKFFDKCMTLKDSVFNSKNIKYRTCGDISLLELAAISNQKHILRKLFILGSTYESKFKITPLTFSIAYGENNKAIIEMLKQYYSIYRNEYEKIWPLIVTAAYGNKLSLLKEFSKHENVNFTEPSRWNALQIASFKDNSEEVIKFLLESGAEIESFGISAVIIAALNKKWSYIDVFSEFIDLKSCKDNTGRNILMIAASQINLGVVKRLVKEYGLNINSRDNNGASALIYLLKNYDDVNKEHECKKICYYLVQNGAVNYEDAESMSAIDYAKKNKAAVICKYLKRKKIPLIEYSKKEIKPIVFDDVFYNALVDNKVDVIDSFIIKGININTTFDEIQGKKSALVVACENNSLDVIKKLLSRGADVNLRSSEGHCALLSAAIFGSYSTLTTLLKYADKIYLNVQDKAGRTALMHSISLKDIEKVRLLIKMGVSLEYEDIYGRTALYYAIEAEDKELLREFSQANMFHTDDKNITPMELTIDLNSSLKSNIFSNLLNWGGSRSLSLRRVSSMIADFDASSENLIDIRLEKYQKPKKKVWPKLSIFNEKWLVLNRENTHEICVLIDNKEKKKNDKRTFQKNYVIDARCRDIEFYPDAQLVELLLENLLTKDKSIFSLIKRVGDNNQINEVIILKDSMDLIHKLNRATKGKKILENYVDYVKFFCANVISEDGSFWIIDDISNLDWSKGEDPLYSKMISDAIKPVKLLSKSSEEVVCEASFLYGMNLFRAELSIVSSGEVTMNEDCLILDDIPLKANQSYGVFMIL